VWAALGVGWSRCVGRRPDGGQAHQQAGGRDGGVWRRAELEASATDGVGGGSRISLSAHSEETKERRGGRKKEIASLLYPCKSVREVRWLKFVDHVTCRTYTAEGTSTMVPVKFIGHITKLS
jgi:hypothetical protein